jgi:ATP-binding cassette subfamily F protein 3
MITTHNISKSFGIQPILRDISFSINEGERVGLIGPNGCGKTTLLKILAGIETPDSGTITHTNPNLRIGYLAQGMNIAESPLHFPEGQTLQSVLNPASNNSIELEAEIASLAAALCTDPNNLSLQTKYDSALRQFAKSNLNWRSALESLDLNEIPLDTPIQHLSGGQKTRLMLAQILLIEPQFVLLDEPTNHLDISAIEWLEGWLKSFSGGVLIVSHDRTFLDNMVSTILYLNSSTHFIQSYPGNYSNYLSQFIKEQKRQLANYRNQENKIRRMKQDIAQTKQQAYRVEITTTPRQPGVRRIAKKVAAKAKSRENKLDRYLDSEERIGKPKPSWQMKLEFDLKGKIGKNVLIAENLSIGYARDRPLLSKLNIQIYAGQRIVLTGSNGSGKTTLVRTLSGNLPPLGGRLKLGVSVKTGYMAQEQELLDPNLNALQTIQTAALFNETEARDFLHYFLFENDDPLRPIRELSFGERSRLLLGLLVARGCTFLLLDEPINHLDIPSRSRFEQALTTYKGTILAVIHDRYFIEKFATDIWKIKDGMVEKV